MGISSLKKQTHIHHSRFLDNSFWKDYCTLPGRRQIKGKLLPSNFPIWLCYTLPKLQCFATVQITYLIWQLIKLSSIAYLNHCLRHLWQGYANTYFLLLVTVVITALVEMSRTAAVKTDMRNGIGDTWCKTWRMARSDTLIQSLSITVSGLWTYMSLVIIYNITVNVQRDLTW